MSQANICAALRQLVHELSWQAALCEQVHQLEPGLWHVVQHKTQQFVIAILQRHI